MKPLVIYLFISFVLSIAATCMYSNMASDAYRNTIAANLLANGATDLQIGPTSIMYRDKMSQAHVIENVQVSVTIWTFVFQVLFISLVVAICQYTLLKLRVHQEST